MDSIQPTAAPASTKRKDVLKAALCGAIFGAVLLALSVYIFSSPTPAWLRTTPDWFNFPIAILIGLPALVFGTPLLIGSDIFRSSIPPSVLEAVAGLAFVLCWAGLSALLTALIYRMNTKQRSRVYIGAVIAIYLCGLALFYFTVLPSID